MCADNDQAVDNCYNKKKINKGVNIKTKPIRVNTLMLFNLLSMAQKEEL